MRVVISPSKGFGFLKIAELWSYRELFYFLALRDVKVRYKQTVLGLAWALIQPLFTMIVFMLFFGRLAGIGSDEVAYPIFSLTGLLPWMFFSSGVTVSSNSLIQEANLIKKIYFPRLIIPCSAIFASLVDFSITCLLLIVLAPFFGVFPTYKLIFFPFFLLFILMSTVGVGLWLSALNAKYRDFRYVVPFFLQLWLFITPIVYPLNLVSQKWQALMALNPMVGVVESFRFMFYQSFDFPVILISFSVSLFVFLTGLIFFKKTEAYFADLV